MKRCTKLPQGLQPPSQKLSQYVRTRRAWVLVRGLPRSARFGKYPCSMPPGLPKSPDDRPVQAYASFVNSISTTQICLPPDGSAMYWATLFLKCAAVGLARRRVVTDTKRQSGKEAGGHRIKT